MQVAEHQRAPAQGDSQTKQLVTRSYVKEIERHEHDCDYQGSRNQPLEADISQRWAIFCRVVVGCGTLFLQGPVENKVMLHVVTAEKPDRSAVQQPMQPIAQ